MAIIVVDSCNRSWDLELSIFQVQELDKVDFSLYLKEADDFSFLTIPEPILKKLWSDESFAFAVIWFILLEQAVQKYKDKEFPINPLTDQDNAQIEFVKGIKGKVKKQFLDAFWRALNDFFPERAAGLYNVRLQLATQLEEVVNTQIPEAMSSMKEAITQEMQKVIQEVNYQKLVLQGGVSSSS